MQWKLPVLSPGGDGSIRVVAKGCREIPLEPVSTRTNNVFSSIVEGTLAGLAAFLCSSPY